VPEDAEAWHDLAELVRGKARKNGAKPAFRFADVELSYREIDERSDRVAGGLAAAGIGPGDRVAALLFNGPEFLALWFGAAKAGAILVPLNTALKGELLRYELADSEPKGIAVDHRLWETYRSARPSALTEWVAGPRDRAGEVAADGRPFAELERSGSAVPELRPQPSDPCSILYTSGTTGPPKGAIIPHEQVLSTARSLAARSRLAPGSVLFTALPLFHCNAQEMTTVAALLHDLTAAYDERFSASRFWESARRFGATHVSLLISMINVLFKQPAAASDRGHAVRTALTAGTSRSIWKEFEARFGLTIVELYGMTECGCTTLMNPPEAIRVGSIGTPLEFVEAEVVDDVDRPVAPGERGELIVRPRSPYSMFLGYHRKPEETVRAWRNLWFHTGDYVTRDPEGYYYFVDRKKDVIRRRGENLAPYDVETVLNRHPAVFESVVVGVPSPLGEEDVKAFVQLRPGARVEPRELFEFAAERLPFFMVPQYIEFIDEIPKTANQKAQRYVLRSRTGGVVYDRDVLGLVLQKQ
jgi:carnitine-CoA ligase